MGTLTKDHLTHVVDINAQKSITLRPRQKELVEKTLGILKEQNRCLAVAPTGAGKTIMMAAIIKGLIRHNSKVLVIQHRGELLEQNKAKFERMYPHIQTSIVEAKSKDFSGKVIFAMVQTLANCLKDLPRISILAVDEAHHAVAETWQAIITKAHRKNPKVKIVGVTATPQRGDRQSLKDTFHTLADHIKLKELVRTQNLVVPKSFVLDLGNNEELKRLYGRGEPLKDEKGNVIKINNDAQIQEEAALILDHDHHTKQVIQHWQDKASNRKTVVFCTNRTHAKHVQMAFEEVGVKCAFVSGEMNADKRGKILKDFEEGKYQLITNVAVLTEGWDCPDVSCVILLRPSSYKGTMIQMVGRGLRTAPGKTDCIILDFGMSSIIHGSLEQEAALVRKEQRVILKKCFSCRKQVPINAKECEHCHVKFLQAEKNTDVPEQKSLEFTPVNLDLVEKQMLEESPFHWVSWPTDDTVMIANSIDAYAVVKNKEYHHHILFVGKKGDEPAIKYQGEREDCIHNGEQFLASHTKYADRHKQAHWIHKEPTDKQLRILKKLNVVPKTRYEAIALIGYGFISKKVQEMTQNAKDNW